MLDTSAIPNSIEPININEILKITEEEKAHIIDTYLSVLVQNMSKDKWSIFFYKTLLFYKTKNKAK